MLPTNRRCLRKGHHPKQLMVWLGASWQRLTDPVFIDEGAKINQRTYLNDILLPHVKPLTETIFRNTHWIIQQDGAPFHTANSTQSWCQEQLPCRIHQQE
jgi:hypothetical protein